jgi:hypothetical protein
MLEKQLIEALQPFIEDLARAEDDIVQLKRLSSASEGKLAEAVKAVFDSHKEELRGPKGDDGRDAPAPDVDALAFKMVDQVSAKLIARHADDLRGPKGEKGERGKDADVTAVTAEVVAKVLADHAEELRGSKGQDGKDADVTAVTALLAKDYSEQLRGPKGEDGKDADPAFVAGILAKDYAEQLRGPAGVSPAVGAVVAKLLAEHSDDIKGPQGEPGKDAEPEAVAKFLASKFAEQLRGEKGERGDKGERGGDGQDGAAGAGIEAPLWQQGVYRKGTVVQHDFGRYSRALCDTANPPASKDWERVGTGGFAFKGVKKSEQQYEIGDIYLDDGSAFIWLGDTAKMLVKRGRDGAEGKRGPKGERGDKGERGTGIADFVFDGKGFALATDDGEVYSIDIGDVVNPVSSALSKEWNLEKRFVAYDEVVQARLSSETPINGFQGKFKPNTNYTAGDLVSGPDGLYLCTQNNRSPDLSRKGWTKLVKHGTKGDPAPDIIGVRVEVGRFVFVKSNGQELQAKADWLLDLQSQLSETIGKFESRLAFLDALIEEKGSQRA